MYILIDDVRDLPVDVIARNGTIGIDLLRAFSWEGLYLDHDMGVGSITGKTVLQYAIQDNVVPPFVQLVTSNPVGRIQMAEMLRDAGYLSIDGFNFKRF